MKKIHNPSVLIIDDDVRMLRALEKVLAGEGCTVTAASWMGEAIDILTERKKRIDLVITDLRMPYVTGITGVYAIHEMLPALPVIVLTAFGSPEVKAECLRQGAVAFLEKPLDTPHLLEVVKNVLGRPKTDSAAHQARLGTESASENINA